MRNASGFAIIVVLTILLLVSLLSFSVLNDANLSYHLAENEMDANQFFILSENLLKKLDRGILAKMDSCLSQGACEGVYQNVYYHYVVNVLEDHPCVVNTAGKEKFGIRYFELVLALYNKSRQFSMVRLESDLAISYKVAQSCEPDVWSGRLGVLGWRVLLS